MVGNLSGDPNAEPRVYASGSDEGFLMWDIHGNLLKHVRVGHNQSQSVSKYRPDLPGLQYMLPVNWRGDGQEFVLLSGNSKEGGMI